MGWTDLRTYRRGFTEYAVDETARLYTPMKKIILLFKVLKRVTSHPFNKKRKLAAAAGFLKWQVAALMTRYPIVYNFTDQSRMIISRGATGATGNLYCGLLEFSEMGFVLHFLRPNDLFVDVGANIGSYTILASGHNRARSVVMEPIPSTFNSLMDNIGINHMEDRVTALNVGVGSRPGKLRFTNSQGAINHVATPEEKDTIEVDVVTLDEILKNEDPALIKIDVEGFETEVCNGAWSVFAKPSLKAIIIELNGLGNRYGYSDNDIDTKLKSLGFAAYVYDPFGRTMTPTDELGSHNTIYVRDTEFVRNRLKSAAMTTIKGTRL